MSIVHETSDVTRFTESVYELRIVLVPEVGGGFSAIARDLPGVASQGETIDEATENIREAFQGACEHYRNQSRSIPWAMNHFEVPADAAERWILVNG